MGLSLPEIESGYKYAALGYELHSSNGLDFALPSRKKRNLVCCRIGLFFLPFVERRAPYSSLLYQKEALHPIQVCHAKDCHHSPALSLATTTTTSGCDGARGSDVPRQHLVALIKNRTKHDPTKKL